MTKSLTDVLREARGLVGAQRPTEATALILARLSGAAPGQAPEAGAPAFAGPTLDLSPLRAGVDGTGPAPAPPKAAPKFRFRPRFGGLAKAPRPLPPLPEGARFLSLRHEGAEGGRSYKLYLPARAVADPALVVMLHGCTQGPDDFALGTRMNALAEEHGVLVAYPEQEARHNPSRCWTWFEPAHQGRGGEPAILAGVVSEIAASHGVDRSRVFAAGLSAGGAMAAILGLRYPELFAAVGVHSGLPAGAARDVPSALKVMRDGGAGRPPSTSIEAPRRMIVFHGARDATVNPKNGDRLAGLDATGGRASVKSGAAGGRDYRRTTIRDEGRTVEHWRVEGLGHAWSGGDGAGSHTDPAGPDASREMLRFFLAETARAAP